jgi:hypothetical protein
MKTESIFIAPMKIESIFIAPMKIELGIDKGQPAFLNRYILLKNIRWIYVVLFYFDYVWPASNCYFHHFSTVLLSPCPCPASLKLTPITAELTERPWLNGYGITTNRPES